MSEEKKKIVVSQIYKHPRSGTIVVHFEFPELNYRNNINFNPQQFYGFSAEQIQAEIRRRLETHYEEKKRQMSDQAFKQTLNAAISGIKAKIKK